MPFPANRIELVQQRYAFLYMSQCKGCGAPIEWWITPQDQRIPMNPMADDEEPAISHFTSCPQADQFRRR